MPTGTIRLGEARVNAGGRKADLAPARFEPAGSIKTPVKEASDVVALPNGSFALVSDTKDSLYIVDENGKVRELHLEGLKGDSQLEGVSYDPVKGHLIVSREESRELLRYEWKGGDDTPKLEKKIELDLDGRENKGIEGLAHLPAELSPTGQAQLIAAKEGDPRQLLMLADNGKGKPLARIEGLAFNARGDLFVLTENDGTLHQLKRKQAGPDDPAPAKPVAGNKYQDELEDE